MKSYKTKMSILKNLYAKEYREWNGKYKDDRQLYCNLYEMLVEALEVLSDIENNFIWCAFNKEFREELKIMDDIRERF